MATATLNPNSTDPLGVGPELWTRTGGATDHGVLADASDATLMTGTATVDFGQRSGFGMETFTLPGGQVVTSLAIKVRARRSAGSDAIECSADCGVASIDLSTVLTGSFAEYSSTVSVGLTQGEIDSLESGISILGDGAGDAVQVSKLWAEVTYEPMSGLGVGLRAG